MLSRSSPRNRESFVRLKSESPKFKEALRKKCQQRWRENRWAFLDGLRNVPEDEVSSALSDAIREDLKSLRDRPFESDLDRNLKDMEEFENDMRDERLTRLLSEYDKILDDEDRLADLLEECDDVVCPVCKRNRLSIETSFVICACGIKIHTSLALTQIRENITRCVEAHNDGCGHDPQFEVIHESDDYHIYLLCYNCSAFSVLF